MLDCKNSKTKIENVVIVWIFPEKTWNLEVIWILNNFSIPIMFETKIFENVTALQLNTNNTADLKIINLSIF